MLGSSPRHSLQNRFAPPGRRWPPQSHEIAQFPCSQGEKPVVLQPPHKIVIGFELGGATGDRSLHMQASESPRSVLDPERPQSASPRSPLSALGSLFTGRSCNPNADLDSEKLALTEHGAEDVVSGEPGVDRISSDALALLKYNRLRAANGQANAKQRERCTHLCCSSVLSSDDEAECTENEIALPKCIFSAGSPTLRLSLHRDQGSEFLSKCFRCKRKLLAGKDIYMYRGDQAFCSQDCRYQQIVAGERKHRGPVGTPCISRVSRGVSGMARATQLAFA